MRARAKVSCIQIISVMLNVVKNARTYGGYQPIYFGNFDFELAVECVNFLGVFKVLGDFWKELKSLYPSLMSKFWFKQDGASSHTSPISRDWVKNHFRKWVVSLKTKFEWAPHSPDLSPPVFFLWGYLRDKVYDNA